jgi:hypothetical protein
MNTLVTPFNHLVVHVSLSLQHPLDVSHVLRDPLLDS